MAEPALTDGDAAALPVLRELLRHEDAQVRLLAACGLGALGRQAAPALPDLYNAIGDADDGVRWRAFHAVQRIEREVARSDEADEER